MLIILVISMPFTLAETVKKTVGKEETDGFLSATVPENEEDITDEGQLSDINIIVNRYEPRVLTSNLLEEQNVPIYAYLSATPTESTTLPRIQKVTITEVKGNRSSQAGVRHIEPKVWSWADIGSIVLRLRKIEKEHKVPDKITVELKARIEYEADVTSNLLGGVQTKIMKETPLTSLQDVIFDPEADIFNGKGHVAVRSVLTNSAMFRIYDSEGKFITEVPAYLGKDSAPVSLERGSTQPEDQVRIRLNKIIDETENSANVIIDGLNHTLIRGTRILDWKVDRIIIKCPSKIEVVDDKNDDESFSTTEKEVKIPQQTCSETSKIKYIKLIRETGEEVILVEGEFKELQGIYDGTNINDKNFDLDIKTSETYVEKIKNGFTKIQRDWGTEFKVEAIKGARRARALFRVGGEREPIEVEIGKEITKGNADCNDELKNRNICKVENILPGRVVISHPDIDLSTKKCKLTTTILALRNLDRRYLSEEVLLPVESETDTLSSSFCDKTIVLDGIETSKAVEFTLLSGFTKGITETTFTLDIPIEKRAIKLSPRSLDKKINSTQELIDKLSKTIEKLEKVVETWTKICLATTALFTIWNFVTGWASGTGEKEEEILTQDKIFEKNKDKFKEGDGQKCTKENGFRKLKGFYSTSSTKSSTKKIDERFATDEEVDESRKEVFLQINEKEKTIDYYFIEDGGKCKRHYAYTIFNENDVEYTYNPLSGDVEPVAPLKAEDYQFIKILKDKENRNVVIIPVNNANQLKRTSVIIQRQYDEWQKTYGEATRSFYFAYYEGDRVEVWKGVGKIDLTAEPRENNDAPIQTYTKGSDRTQVYQEFERRFIQPVGTAQKRGDSKVNIFGEEYKLDTSKKIRGDSIKCEEVLGPTQCKLMYNACDPVMCPASRCNLGGRYDVPDDNVIKSGLIGSIVLCAPNFIATGGEVVVPICLSGILASMKNIRSYLQAYKQCLITAKADDKAVGICDKIRSIFMCEIIWKEAMTILNLKGGLLNIFTRNIGGGDINEMSSFGKSVKNLKNTVDFFTNSYATTIFASYQGKTTEEIGSEVCKSAIGGAFPNLGEFVNEISQPEDPPQFTAYFEEHEYSPTQKESRYNVFYHIYAGTPRGTSAQPLNYYIFLRKQGLRDFPVARGVLKSGEFSDESKDFRGPEGYQEICISMNGAAQCGFGKVVSSSFGINQIANKYLAENLASKIEKAEDCVPSQKSGLANFGAGYIPTASVERRCSYTNPYSGLGKAKEKEWYDIGSCGADQKGKTLGRCWEHANLERYPSIQAQVFEDSCTENQNAQLCEVDQKCHGGVLREFEIKAQTPILTSGKTDLGVRECCSGECKPIYDLSNAIESALKEFGEKEELAREAYKKIRFEFDGFNNLDSEFTGLGEDESKYKNEYHHFMALILTQRKLYKAALDQIDIIKCETARDKCLAIVALEELIKFYNGDAETNINSNGITADNLDNKKEEIRGYIEKKTPKEKTGASTDAKRITHASQLSELQDKGRGIIKTKSSVITIQRDNDKFCLLNNETLVECDEFDEFIEKYKNVIKDDRQAINQLIERPENILPTENEKFSSEITYFFYPDATSVEILKLIYSDKKGWKIDDEDYINELGDNEIAVFRNFFGLISDLKEKDFLTGTREIFTRGVIDGSKSKIYYTKNSNTVAVNSLEDLQNNAKGNLE